MLIVIQAILVFIINERHYVKTNKKEEFILNLRQQIENIREKLESSEPSMEDIRKHFMALVNSL